MGLTHGGETNVWPQHDQKVLWSLPKLLTMQAMPSRKPAQAALTSSHPFSAPQNILPTARDGMATQKTCKLHWHTLNASRESDVWKSGEWGRAFGISFYSFGWPLGKKKRTTNGKFDHFILAWENVGVAMGVAWQWPLRDTSEWDIVAFQWLLFRQTAPKLQTCKDEVACNPKEQTLLFSAPVCAAQGVIAGKGTAAKEPPGTCETSTEDMHESLPSNGDPDSVVFPSGNSG